MVAARGAGVAGLEEGKWTFAGQMPTSCLSACQGLHFPQPCRCVSKPAFVVA